MSKAAVAMLGARMHYAVPRLLHEAGLLDSFFTDSYIGNKPWLEMGLRAMPAAIRPHAVDSWLGRKDDVIPPEKVTSFERLGIWYGRARQRARGVVAMSEVYLEAALRFNRHILSIGLGDAQVVWGFNGAALELFQAAKQQGRRCVLEQTILPLSLQRELLQQEQVRWPASEQNPCDWAQPLAMDGREEAEWELADAIVAGSEFVSDGLVEMGVPAKKIHVIPYGVDLNRLETLAGARLIHSSKEGSLKVLFAGEVGLRKGALDLLEAARLFEPGEIEIRVAGGVSLRREILNRFSNHADFLGHIPRSMMSSLFQWADVLVLPSIVEGSATVTYESMVAGCPVITTPNAGSIIQDGVDGFIVPIRRPDKVAESLKRYRYEPGLLEAHRAALVRSKERAGLYRYKADLAKLVQIQCT